VPDVHWYARAIYLQSIFHTFCFTEHGWNKLHNTWSDLRNSPVRINFLHSINSSEWALEPPNTGMTKNSTMPLIFCQNIVIEREIPISKTQLHPKGL